MVPEIGGTPGGRSIHGVFGLMGFVCASGPIAVFYACLTFADDESVMDERLNSVLAL